MFDQPVDHAWREYRAVLKSERMDNEDIAIAQEAFKAGWAAAKDEYETENNL